MNPKVSVCMPNYNLGRFLPEAIESVLRQSFADFEFIIIDNCSTDDSVEIINRYAAIDRRISTTVNERNIGLVNNMNRCLERAKGEYIKFLFSDDVLVSTTTLERMVSVLDEHPNVALVASARYVIDEKSNIQKKWIEYRERYDYPGVQIIQDCLFEQKNRIGEPSVVLFRRIHANGGFDVRYRQAVDLAMWMRILERGDFAYIEEPLCSFRIHREQQTNANIRDIGTVEEPFYLLKDYGAKSYITMPRPAREYMHYVPVYALWKLYKNERISRKAAFEKIRGRYNVSKFFVYYPLYKSYKFFDRLGESMKRYMHAGVLVHKEQTGLQSTEAMSVLTRQQSYYEYTRTEIRELIPQVADRVLEIGCGVGNTLQWLRTLKHCSWVGGVEMSPETAAKARETLNEVYAVNIEHNDLPIPEGSLDLILCLDVLEHMIDPWSVVRRLRQLLKPGGALIASIPNVRHVKALVPLLFSGKWQYADEGILDRSHLRFFVRETAIDLIASSGFLVDMVIPTGLGRSRRSQIMNRIVPSLVTSLFEKQYLIRGVRVN